MNSSSDSNSLSAFLNFHNYDLVAENQTVGTFRTFSDAVTIWINKPQVVNRRLCGAKIVFQDSTTSRNVTEFIQYCLTKVESVCASSHHSDHDVAEVPALSSFDETTLYLVIRETYHKQREHLAPREMVVFDYERKHATFIPMSKLPGGSKSCSLPYDIAYQICFMDSVLDSTKSDSKIYLKVIQPNGETSKSYTDWLKTTLLKKITIWSAEKQLKTSITSLRLVSINRYNEIYNMLKDKYGKKFVEIWPEKTDPQKFVYEDIAIAAYLLITWELEKAEKKLENKQSFVDLGCGNGLLVHILQSEGHQGLGLDVRKRNIWDLYGDQTNLKEEAITPSSEQTFANFDWLIGNHSDELTPWIPVIAARSSYRCSYFVLPCCHYDFDCKFKQKEAGESNYRSYLNYIRQVGEVCGFNVQEDMLRIPSTKRICFIGKSRNYKSSEFALINDKIETFIKIRSTKIPSDLQIDSSEIPIKKSRTDNAWSAAFSPRPNVEKSRNCKGVKSKTVNHIVHTVFNALLGCPDCQVKNLSDGRTWRKGGKKPLSEVVKLFDRELLKELKSECGGLQTLLRNHNSVFNVSGGNVQLRDLTLDEPYSKHSKLARKDNSQYFKTMPCWFFSNHPDGCPRTSQTCTFAHGEDELVKRE